MTVTKLTRSKVKVKITDLLKFQQLHFSTSTSSAVLACHRSHAQLMGDVITIVRDLVYSFLEPDFCISPPIGGHVTSKFRPQQAVHAGGDDRQPPCGAFYFNKADSSQVAHARL